MAKRIPAAEPRTAPQWRAAPARLPPKAEASGDASPLLGIPRASFDVSAESLDF